MKQKFYSVLGLIVGFGGLILAAYTKKLGNNVYLYVLLGSFVFILISVAELFFYTKRKKKLDEAKESENEKELPEYRRKGSIMSKPERELYYALKDMFADKYEVLPQVALNSVIDKLTQNSYRSELFRIADYCIIDKDTYAPLLLLELNDSSHKRADRIERDKKVAQICERAGLPLVTITMQDLNDIPKIRRNILKNILRK